MGLEAGVAQMSLISARGLESHGETPELLLCLYAAVSC